MEGLDLRIEQAGDKDMGVCACCGTRSRRIWGYVYQGDSALAAYLLFWTIGQVPKHGAHLDLILGDWGEQTSAADRCVVSLEYRRDETARGFRVIDADDSKASLAARSLRRDEVVGTEIAQNAFAIVDAIWAQDPRTAEVQGLES